VQEQMNEIEHLGKPAQIYLDEPFREYVKEKYFVEN
jgi:hypothetical protein